MSETAMKLYHAPSSPFARKVRVAIRQLGLQRRVEEVAIDPWTSEELRRFNPLAKVPTLIVADGTALPESDLICEYLDHYAREAGGDRRLLPEPGPARWTALRRQAVADGLAAAAARLYADEQRPESQRSAVVMQRQRLAIAAALSQLQREASDLDPNLGDVGAIAVACALSYFLFRWPESTGWRSAHASLAAWFAAVDTLPAMQATGYRLLDSNVSRLGAG